MELLLINGRIYTMNRTRDVYEGLAVKDGRIVQLGKTDDILSWLGEHRWGGQILCGFSMETENLLENSRKKLEKKNIDMIVANNLKVSGAGFGTDTNVVTLITKDGEEELEKMSKDEVAHRILDKIFGIQRS